MHVIECEGVVITEREGTLPKLELFRDKSINSTPSVITCFSTRERDRDRADSCPAFQISPRIHERKV